MAVSALHASRKAWRGSGADARLGKGAAGGAVGAPLLGSFRRTALCSGRFFRDATRAAPDAAPLAAAGEAAAAAGGRRRPNAQQLLTAASTAGHCDADTRSAAPISRTLSSSCICVAPPASGAVSSCAHHASSDSYGGGRMSAEWMLRGTAAAVQVAVAAGATTAAADAAGSCRHKQANRVQRNQRCARDSAAVASCLRSRTPVELTSTRSN